MCSQKTVSLTKIIYDLGIENTQLLLNSVFRCSRNIDVENFLLHKAIRFEMADAAATHLIIDDKQQIIAYFSLSFKTLDLNVSKTLWKKLSNGLGENGKIKAFLIGQIGKNDLIQSNITLQEILKSAFEKIHIAKQNIGGRVVILECEDNPKLISLYENHGFRLIETKENQILKTMYIIPEFK